LREVLPQWKSMPMNVSVAFVKSRQAAPRVSAFVDWLAELFERSQEMDDTLTRLFSTARRPAAVSMKTAAPARAARDEDTHEDEETASES
jgi:LysR family transcriptional regulator, regulator for bpeEF and oprC